MPRWFSFSNCVMMGLSSRNNTVTPSIGHCEHPLRIKLHRFFFCYMLEILMLVDGENICIRSIAHVLPKCHMNVTCHISMSFCLWHILKFLYQSIVIVWLSVPKEYRLHMLQYFCGVVLHLFLGDQKQSLGKYGLLGYFQNSNTHNLRGSTTCLLHGATGLY